MFSLLIVINQDYIPHELLSELNFLTCPFCGRPLLFPFVFGFLDWNYRRRFVFHIYLNGLMLIAHNSV